MQPHIGHLEQFLHIFTYLKHHEQSTMVCDPKYITWDASQFPRNDWQDFYKDAIETLPPIAPAPKGNPVQINAVVNGDHAGNHVTHCSQTGILIYTYSAPVF
jgi:hypothetical protein